MGEESFTLYEIEAIDTQSKAEIAEMNILSLENDILRKIAKDTQEKLEEVKSLIGMWRGMATLAEETAEGMKGDLLEDLTKSALLGQKVSDLRLCASCLEIILDEPKIAE